MRVWIEISAAGDEAYRVDVKLGSENGETLATHAMRRLDQAPWVAPATGDAGSQGKARAAMERVAEGKPHEGQVRLLGQHFFESLLGHGAWDEILRKAEDDDVRMIELALSWPADLQELHSPPWEAMHDGDDFLGANGRLSIALTRVVQAEWCRDAPPRVPSPARVLFAIGTKSSDPEIKVGMEVVGLLREAERGPGAIDPLILEEASIDSLADACANFQPHIVHFVGHGRISSQGKGELGLCDPRTEKREMVGAIGLMGALNAAPKLPLVVMLTGCKSAASGRHVDPLAAELVRNGIPIAVGMAGRIADPVCRLFARRFGVSLSKGEALVKAVTDGRRAGLQKQAGEAEDDPAWVLPSVYIAPKVTAEYAPVNAANPSPVQALVKNYDISLDPVFCGRVNLTRQFDRLLTKEDDRWTLVAYTEGREQLGRTRLLHEFAVRALRRGHLVVMIDDKGNDISLLPRTPSGLATDMLEATMEARKHFDLDAPRKSLLVKELERAGPFRLELDGADSANQRRGRFGTFIDACREGSDEINDELIRGMLPEILSNDLVELAADAREHSSESFSEESRVVVILGGVGNWGELTAPLFSKLLNSHGLGTSKEPVPVFATCALEDSRRELEDARDNANPASTNWEPFDRFRGGEELLAYLNFLLYPLKAKPGGMAMRSYVPNCNPPSHAHDWEETLKLSLEGVPGKLEDPLMRIVVHMLAEVESLLEADDDDVMKRYLAGQ
jgi:hypothetical protein